MNGKELYTFKHRIPLEKVSTLNISGDVAVNLSGFMQVSYFLFSSMNDLSQNPVRMRIAWRVKSCLKSRFSVPSLELESICISYRRYNKNHQTGKLTWGTFHRTSRDIAASPKPCECLVFSSDF